MRNITITENAGHTFSLSKGIIKENDWLPHIATKAQIRRVVNLKVGQKTYFFHYLRRVGYWLGFQRGRGRSDAERLPYGVRLGCCYFFNKNFRTLKRWANS